MIRRIIVSTVSCCVKHPGNLAVVARNNILSTVSHSVKQPLHSGGCFRAHSTALTVVFVPCTSAVTREQHHGHTMTLKKASQRTTSCPRCQTVRLCAKQAVVSAPIVPCTSAVTHELHQGLPMTLNGVLQRTASCIQSSCFYTATTCTASTQSTQPLLARPVQFTRHYSRLNSQTAPSSLGHSDSQRSRWCLEEQHLVHDVVDVVGVAAGTAAGTDALVVPSGWRAATTSTADNATQGTTENSRGGTRGGANGGGWRA